ncbi:N-acetyltransferase [Arthrobotrys entomopaga]|nr:N-acetyltransferase [Arthrobotrys entomopaga]
MTQPNTIPLFHIRPAVEQDLPQITSIVNHYITHTTVNYTLRALPATHYQTVLSEATLRKLPFIVAARSATSTTTTTENVNETENTVPAGEREARDLEEKILGFASVSPWTPSKLGYAHTLELTIYNSPDQRGGGVGTALLNSILHELETKEYLTFSEGGLRDVSSTSISRSELGSNNPVVGIPVKCKKVLAVMAVSADKVVDEKVKRFYLRNGFVEAGYLSGIGWKFGGEQDVRYLMKDINEGYTPRKDVWGA